VVCEGVYCCDDGNGGNVLLGSGGDLGFIGSAFEALRCGLLLTWTPFMFVCGDDLESAEREGTG
jgi:hypothetical protein